MEGSRSYALKDQMLRASLSVPSNIAEGYERDSPKDFKRFLRYSKSSCAELRTKLYIYKRYLSLTGNPTDHINSLIDETK